MAKEDHELPSRHKVSMKKERRKIERAGSERHFYTLLPSLIFLAEPNANSTNQKQTVQIKCKQCKSNANGANQKQTVQIKHKQCKSNTNNIN